MNKLSAFLHGMASIIDLFGTLNKDDYEFEKDDYVALHNDWQKIGYDFKSVIGDWNKYGK